MHTGILVAALAGMVWMYGGTAANAAAAAVAVPVSELATPNATSDVVDVRPWGIINWSRHVLEVRGQSLPVSAALSFGGPIRQAGGALTLARADVQARVARLGQTMCAADLALGTSAAHDAGTAAGGAQGHEGALISAPWGAGHTVMTQFYADGHVALTQAFGWDAALAEVLWQARQVSIAAPPKAGAPGIAVPAPESVVVGIPTGLIVEAHGLAVQPALLPEVQDDAGRVLYSVRDVHPQALSRHGVGRYTYSIDAALKDGRMGAHPVVVRAHATAPGAPAVLVVDARQAALVRAASAALAQAKLMVVLDEQAALCARPHHTALRP